MNRGGYYGGGGNNGGATTLGGGGLMSNYMAPQTYDMSDYLAYSKGYTQGYAQARQGQTNA